MEDAVQNPPWWLAASTPTAAAVAIISAAFPLPLRPPPLVGHLDLLRNPSFNTVRESEGEGERRVRETDIDRMELYLIARC
jgi:hypothetical protein